MAKAPERMQRRHVREKATIDHLVQDVYKPKPPDERHAPHSPTTSTGLPVEDQVHKEWDPQPAEYFPAASGTDARCNLRAPAAGRSDRPNHNRSQHARRPPRRH
jgi:hypothetical protein